MLPLLQKVKDEVKVFLSTPYVSLGFEKASGFASSILPLSLAQRQHSLRMKRCYIWADVSG
jgi:hypothetical protein